MFPLIEQIPANLSPCELFQIIKEKPYCFFLDSGVDEENIGRYSFLGYDPFLVFRSKKSTIGITDKKGSSIFDGNPFRVLRDLLSTYRVENIAGLPPFLCGACGYFGYDLKHFIERLPSIALDDLGLSDCMLGFYNKIIIIDNLKKETFICSVGFPYLDEKDFFENAKQNLTELRNIIKAASPKNHEYVNLKVKNAKKLISNFSKEHYINTILRAKEYIKEGEVYQVNLSQRLASEFYGSSDQLYTILRKINPAPFAAYLDFKDTKIISASPERFLKLEAGILETRPIKGTRPRSKEIIYDKLFESQLCNSAKDKAEHVMIVDLERNDLGRICEYGSVKVAEFEILEKYSTVFHLVSTIRGRLLPQKDLIDCFYACFPGGSITGAPKIRSMEIIEELEPTKRSIYTGSIGYLSFSGNMDLSIVIRTIIHKGNKLYFQVGGGIVADSDPEKEFDETMDKAKALIESISIMNSEKVFI